MGYGPRGEERERFRVEPRNAGTQRHAMGSLDAARQSRSLLHDLRLCAVVLSHLVDLYSTQSTYFLSLFVLRARYCPIAHACAWVSWRTGQGHESGRDGLR